MLNEAAEQFYKKERNRCQTDLQVKINVVYKHILVYVK